MRTRGPKACAEMNTCYMPRRLCVQCSARVLYGFQEEAAVVGHQLPFETGNYAEANLKPIQVIRMSTALEPCP